MKVSEVINEEIGWKISYNVNYLDNPEESNIFLDRIEFGQIKECYGSADKQSSGKWVVLVSAPYDPETDSDARLVGEFESQQAAIEALWNERY